LLNSTKIGFYTLRVAPYSASFVERRLSLFQLYQQLLWIQSSIRERVGTLDSNDFKSSIICFSNGK
jgi:hypothetical protein